MPRGSLRNTAYSLWNSVGLGCLTKHAHNAESMSRLAFCQKTPILYSDVQLKRFKDICNHQSLVAHNASVDNRTRYLLNIWWLSFHGEEQVHNINCWPGSHALFLKNWMSQVTFHYKWTQTTISGKKFYIKCDLPL